MAGSENSNSSSSSNFDRASYSEQPQTLPPRSGFVIEEINSEDEAEFGSVASGSPITMAAATESMIPDLFTSLPPIRDFLNTGSSQIQDQTIQECLPFLAGIKEDIKVNAYGLPNLDRKRHIAFLHKTLARLPAAYVAADASRPWMFYWALNGLWTMGEDISQYRERVISTTRPIQNATGGFGGGNGQASHLAPTYAIVLSVALVGGKEALEVIDRKAMWKWLGALKQKDGSFQMSVGGEVDMR